MSGTNDFIHPAILELLIAAEKIFRQYNIEYYLVGALARDMHLSINSNFPPARRTKDVDIAVLISDEQQFHAIKHAMIDSGDFSLHETEAIKLIYKHKIELDLMPFGGIENKFREALISEPRLFVIDVPGFQEAYIDIEEFVLQNDVTLKVCSLEALILLKLIAYDDNPTRTKDIIDIGHILSVYFDLNDEKIYERHLDVMELYDTSNNDFLKQVSARIVGRHIASLLSRSEPLYKRLLNILKKKNSIPYHDEMADGMLDEKHIAFITGLQQK